MRLLMTLMIHSGNALTATMTATFHPNRAEITNDRSEVRVQEAGSVQGADMERDHHKPKYSGRNIMLNAYMPRVTTSEMII
jgi:hypothetical protein